MSTPKAPKAPKAVPVQCLKLSSKRRRRLVNMRVRQDELTKYPWEW